MDVLLSVSKQIKTKAVNLADTVGGTDIEKKVKIATSNENFPTPLSQYQEIAYMTNNYENCREIMPLLWKRMSEEKEYWRIIYKCLALLHELLRFGSDSVIDETREHMFQLRQLENFRYQEEGKERGNGIREKAVEIMELVNDPNKLRAVREECERNKGKYTGQSNNGGGSYGGYSGGSSYGGGGGGSSYGGGGGGGSYDDGPSNKYSGYGGGGGGSSSSYDDPKKKKSSFQDSENNNNNDDPYGEATTSKKSKKDDKGEKSEKKAKKNKDKEKEKERDTPSPMPAVDDDLDDEEKKKAAKKAKKASKKAQEAAEQAKLNAPKLEGGKLAPPPAGGQEAPDLFNPRATPATSSPADDFTSFQTAPSAVASSSNNDLGFSGFTSAPASKPAASSNNTLDELFNFDGAPPAKPVQQNNGSSFNFDQFVPTSSTPSSSAASSSNNNTDWNAFATSNLSSSSSSSQQRSTPATFDLLGSPSGASAGGQKTPSGGASAQSQAGIFDAFQGSGTANRPGSTNSAKQAAAATPKSSDAWTNDLVKLDLGSSKPTGGASGVSVHIPASKSSDPFSHLIPNQPRPQMMQGQQGQQGGMRPQGGMMQQGGGGMMMGQQQQMGMGMQGGMQGGMGGGMGMGGMGGMGMQQQQQQQPGFGFPQSNKAKSHDIFF